MPRRAPARATLASRTLAAVTSGALFAAALAPSRAAAANVMLQGSGTASVGFTDNIVNAPDEPTATGATRQSDVLFQLAPRVLLASSAPRLMQRLGYGFTADLFARHSEASSYSNTLEWNGNVLTSPTTSLLLAVTSLQGKVSTFAFNQPSSGATVAVLPQNNNVGYFSQSVSETFEARPRVAWRVLEQLRFNAFVPLDRGRLADSYRLTVEGGAERIFAVDAVGLILRCDFVDFVQPRDPTTDVAGFDQRQLLTSLLARWRRDWSPSWSSEAALGLIAAVGASSDPTAATQSTWAPSALAALRWSREVGAGELRYAHEVTPDALAAATLSRDAVTLQAGAPIVRARLFFGATAGYQHVRTVPLAAAVAAASADVVLVDATVGWQPIPEVGLFARYAYFKQYGSRPVAGVPAMLPDLTRNTVMIGVNVLYPAATPVRIATRPASRVDGADQAAFPELHAPQPR